MPQILLTAAPKQSPDLRLSMSRLEDHIFDDILVPLVQTVRNAIISAAGPSGSKIGEGLQLKIEKGAGRIHLGSVTQLNEATKMNARTEGGQWRFGWWFNLEFGREYPRVGEGWIYQEVPGPAKFPGDPASDVPPGATLADVMNGLKLAPRAGLAGSLTGQSTFRRIGGSRSLTGVFHTKEEREWHAKMREAFTRSRGQPSPELSGLTRQTRFQGYEHYVVALYKVRLQSDEAPVGFQTGQVGRAPIRIGYREGIEEAYQRQAAAWQDVVNKTKGYQHGVL